VLASLNLAFQMAELELRAGTFAQSMPAAVDAAAPASNGSSNGESDPRLSALIHRLDAALGDDGRLL
jgi:cell division protein ZapA